MSQISIIARRELASYFATPTPYIFIVIFLILNGICTFYLGNFYERDQADLAPFFSFHPWLYLLLVPAISMRIWSEERKTGTIELLMTLPVSLWQAVLGKFFAAWLFISLAVALTFPIWLTVNYLGTPDNGAIVTAYLASILMAGGFLAIGCCISAASQNQVVAFIISLTACFAMLLAGTPMVLDFFSTWAPNLFISAIANLSFLKHFNNLSKGVIELSDLSYFLLVIICWLYATTILLDLKKAD